MNGVGKPNTMKSTGWVVVSYNSYKFLSKSYTRAIL